jgi:glycosyltransferase involved in cell wall biosynthesis
MAIKFPKISVIIPTWNRELLIKEAIESVLNQTTPVHEIILCDDGSSDQTIEYVKNTFGKKVKILSLNHSGRPSIPRNRGIHAATGEYIAFLDSDDLWMPNKLELQLNPNFFAKTAPSYMFLTQVLY